MVNNNSAQFLVFAVPALASLVVAGTTWWTAPRRGATLSVVRAAVQRWIPAALVTLISVAFGVAAYLGHAPGVGTDRVLEGAVIALVASGFALSLYWVLGRAVRHAATLIGAWALSLLPLYYDTLIALLMVVAYTQCGPGAPDCPLG